MKLDDVLGEDGRIVKGVNTTVDVGPDEIKKQAKKFGNTVDKHGNPPTLSKKVKGSKTNVLFNLGLAEDEFTEMERAVMEGSHSIDDLDERKLKSKSYKKSLSGLKAAGRRPKRKLHTKFSEGYKLQLERDTDMMVLNITDTKTGKRTEVRGKSGYESGNYDPNDSLHMLLDKVGKTANVSELINGEVVTINPKHPDADRAKTATDKAFSEDEEQQEMKKLDIQQAEPIRKKFAPDWEIRKGTYLFKKVAFDDYNQALRFLMAIEKPQVELDHFADFMNFYNELTIAITTHDVKGLTQLDFELALYIDKALEQMDARQLEENFADGKKKGKSRPGRVKKSGASCNGSVTELRKKAKNASGEKAKMYHWCANMKSGRKKK